jgi:Flp pilus assembly protein TadD/cell division protein FtsN
MKSIRLAAIAATSLMTGVMLVGTHPAPSIATQSPMDKKAIKMATKAVERANTALAKQQGVQAVAAAEEAVSYQPRDANLRFLLGRAYVAAGRFASAETSFSDALTLMPDNAKAGLHLALAEIAQGKRDQALTTLNDFRDNLSAADLGLALALAGNVDGAVATLEAGVRAGENTAKLRQNLALTYAMQGKWSDARVMAMQDLPEDKASARLAEWANFVRPATSFDQVASLLGVTPVDDMGQPTRLALNGTAAPAQRVVVNVDNAPAVDASDGQVIDSQAPVATAGAAQQAPYFETRSAMAQAPVTMPALPEAPIVSANPTPAKQMMTLSPSASLAAAVPARKFGSGRFVVQLGAYRNAKFSRAAWGRLANRYGLKRFEPGNAAAKVRGMQFVRLTVGGFVTRAEAAKICIRIQSSGGSCFVRGRFGDQVASWVQSGMPKAKAVKASVRVAKRDVKRPVRAAKVAKPVRVASR